MGWIDRLRGLSGPAAAGAGTPGWPVLRGCVGRPPWPYWPTLAGYDYRYGFPVDPLAIEFIEDLPGEQRAFVLGQLEQAVFEALVRVDLEALP